MHIITLLIHLDHTVDLSYEPEAGEEADGARQQEEQKDHDQCVAKVQERRGHVLDLQLGYEIVATVDEQVHGGES